MAEQITKTCPVCGRLAIRMCTGGEVNDADGNVIGYGSKYACFTGTTRGAGHWQETAPLLPRRVLGVAGQKPQTSWAILNALTNTFSSPERIDSARVMTATAERQARFDDAV